MIIHNRGAMLAGLGVGAGLMYFLDPGRGARRRAAVRDRVTHAVNVTGDAAGATGRDLAHRASGAAARLRGTFAQEPVDDRVLVDRVRARFGRVVSHPHAIDVEASDGVVTLRGPILQAEVPQLLGAVERIPGVREVVNNLEVHEQAGNIPALQGGTTPPGLRSAILPREWSPTARLVAGSLGFALTGYGASRRTVPGALLAAAGIGLVARAATNLDTQRLTGLGAGRRAIEVQKTITIDAPVDQVFRFWAAYENFSEFMSHVLDVRPGAQEGQSHWTVAGPGGVPVSFDAEISEFVHNELLAWHSLEGSTVAHAGVVRFEAEAGNKTRVQIRMAYNPPGGWIGHGVATAFGVDPKSSLDADLVRLKTLIETGRPPHDAPKSDSMRSTF